MLQILQYFSLICAFFLPFAIGWLVQAIRSGDRHKLLIAGVSLAVALLVIVFTVWLAFGIQSAAGSVVQ